MPRYEIPLTCIHHNGRTETTLAKVISANREQAVTDAIRIYSVYGPYASVSPFLDSDKG